MPAGGERVANVREGGVEVWFRGEAGGVERRVPVNAVQLLRRLGIRRKELQQRALKVKARKRLLVVSLEVVRDEGIPLLPADEVVERVEKVEALLVGDRGEGVIRVLAGEGDDELREAVGGAEEGDGLLEGFPADDGGEVEVGFAVEGADDAALEVDRPTFVEPEVFPVGGGDEVAGPGVREFVRCGGLAGERGGGQRERTNHVDVCEVLVEGHEGCKYGYILDLSPEIIVGVANVMFGFYHTLSTGPSLMQMQAHLHSSVWEARRQNKHIKHRPRVRIHNPLRDLQELLHIILQLQLTLQQLLRPSIDSRSRPNRRRRNIPRRQRKEVRRDGDVLLEGIRQRPVLEVLCASGKTGCNNIVRRADRHGKGGLHRGGILARVQRARVDRLALRDFYSISCDRVGGWGIATHIRRLLVRGLLGRHPLQRRAFVRRRVRDLHTSIRNLQPRPRWSVHTLTLRVSPFVGFPTSATVTALPYGSLRSATFHSAGVPLTSTF